MHCFTICWGITENYFKVRLRSSLPHQYRMGFAHEATLPMFLSLKPVWLCKKKKKTLEAFKIAFGGWQVHTARAPWWFCGLLRDNSTADTHAGKCDAKQHVSHTKTAGQARTAQSPGEPVSELGLHFWSTLAALACTVDTKQWNWKSVGCLLVKSWV